MKVVLSGRGLISLRFHQLITAEPFQETRRSKSFLWPLGARPSTLLRKQSCVLLCMCVHFSVYFSVCVCPLRWCTVCVTAVDRCSVRVILISAGSLAEMQTFGPVAWNPSIALLFLSNCLHTELHHWTTGAENTPVEKPQPCRPYGLHPHKPHPGQTYVYVICQRALGPKKTISHKLTLWGAAVKSASVLISEFKSVRLHL